LNNRRQGPDVVFVRVWRYMYFKVPTPGFYVFDDLAGVGALPPSISMASSPLVMSMESACPTSRK
jgi:hypothetical protein